MLRSFLLLVASLAVQADSHECPAKAHVPYFQNRNYGGFTNARWTLLTGMMYAHQENFTYLTFPVWNMDTMLTACKEFETQHPISRLYDMDYLIRYSARHGLRVISIPDRDVWAQCCKEAAFRDNFQVQPGASVCIDGSAKSFFNIRHHIHAPLNFEQFFEANTFVVKNHTRSSHLLPGGLWYITTAKLSFYRRALKPTAIMQGHLDKLVAELKQQMDGTTSYPVVHARVEPDLKLMEHPGNPGFVAPTQNDIVKYLLRVRGLRRRDKIYVCSFMSKLKMKLICSVFRCYQIFDLTLPKLFNGCPMDKLPEDLMAYLDFEMALRGNMFIGSQYSSFSAELYAMYEMVGKPAYFFDWNGRYDI